MTKVFDKTGSPTPTYDSSQSTDDNSVHGCCFCHVAEIEKTADWL